ncbi:MAG: hypothetical protein ACFE85_11785 [Candidatus Hodarchaeota archaeon]
MKNKTIQISRTEWESLIEFKRTPIKKRYLDLLELENLKHLELKKAKFYDIDH